MRRISRWSRTRKISQSGIIPELYYIRHGETDWNAEMRFQGRMDIPLNETGRAQAKRNGQALSKVIKNPEAFDFVASPLGRTRETMEIIKLELGLDPQAYRTDERLIEASYGDLEGTTLDDLKANQRELHVSRKQDRWNFQPPGGESLDMTYKRIIPVLVEINVPSIIVGHGAVGRTVRKHMLDLQESDAGLFHFTQDKVFHFLNGKEAVI